MAFFFSVRGGCGAGYFLWLEFKKALFLSDVLYEKLPVTLPEAFMLSSLFRLLGIQDLLLGKPLTLHVAVHTDINIIFHIVSYSSEVLSMWLIEGIPLCSLKAPSQRVSSAPLDLILIAGLITGYVGGGMTKQIMF